MAPFLKILQPTAFLLWIVITESYNRNFKTKTAFSSNNGIGSRRIMLRKEARMMFSGIVEVFNSPYSQSIYVYNDEDDSNLLKNEKEN